MAAQAVAKEIKGKVLSGEAKPGPSIGQALGPLGLNMAEFCKQFNAATSKMKPGVPTPVRLTAFKDRTFAFNTLTPPTTWFLKKCANIEKGSARPVLEMVGKVTLKQVYEIAQIKQKDEHVSHIPLDNICRSVIGTARSMGIEIIAGKQASGSGAKSAPAAEKKSAVKAPQAAPASTKSTTPPPAADNKKTTSK